MAKSATDLDELTMWSMTNVLSVKDFRWSERPRGEVKYNHVNRHDHEHDAMAILQQVEVEQIRFQGNTTECGGVDIAEWEDGSSLGAQL